jgi:cytochrome P450
MLHDKKIYSNPMTFQPDRFLSPNAEPDPMDVAFGFGRYLITSYCHRICLYQAFKYRRRCPGIYFADAAIYIGCTMSLAVFNVSKSIDPETGKEIEPAYIPLPGTVRCGKILFSLTASS